MTKEMFSAEHFVASLDRYGSDLAQWPAPMRATAATWLVTQPEAQRLLQQAETTTQALKELARPLPMDGMAYGRLLSGLAARRQAATRASTFQFSPRAAFASFAFAAMLFVGGFWTGGQVGIVQEPDTTQVIAFNHADDSDVDQDDYLDALITGEI